MLTTSRLFEGATVSHILASVLKTEPDWAALPPDTPSVLRRVLRHCLAKDRKERLHDIADARLEIAEVARTSGTETATAGAVPQLRVWQRPIPAAVVALAIAAMTGLAAWTLTRPDLIPADVMRFAIVPPDTAPLNRRSVFQNLAISPDGTQVVYVGPNPSATGSQLNLRAIDQVGGAPLRGGDGGFGPFVSPDSEWVGFLRRTGGTTLQKVSIFGGPPVMLTESAIGIVGASWGADDQIVFGAAGAGLFRISGGGGEPEVLTSLNREQGEESHAWPFVIPGANAVLFVIALGRSPVGNWAARRSRPRHGGDDAPWPGRRQPAIRLDGSSRLRRRGWLA